MTGVLRTMDITNIAERQNTAAPATLNAVKSGLVRTGQVKSGQDRVGQDRVGQVRLGQVRLGQGRSGQVRTGQVRLGQVIIPPSEAASESCRGCCTCRNIFGSLEVSTLPAD
jgi:hypothetical protein